MYVFHNFEQPNGLQCFKDQFKKVGGKVTPTNAK